MAPRILVVDDHAEFLSLLVQLLEDAGYEAVGSGRGAHALESARNQPPAIAVIDLLLPDMTGHQLADALRKNQPDLPLIFITGVFKGGKHAMDARQKYAVADYFEKPFDAARLLDAVRKLADADKDAAAAVPRTGSFDDVELDIDVDEEGFEDPLELTGYIKVTGDNLTTEIRGANLTAAPLPKPPPPPVAAPPVAAPRVAAPPPVAAPFVAAPPVAAPPPPPGVASARPAGHRRGALKDNLPALVTAFYLAGETGELGVQRGQVKKVVYFERGMPVFALSNLMADRFGPFLVRVGKITPAQLEEVAALATASGRRTGDVLIERGLLKDSERMYYVGQQVKAIIYSLFAWEDGSYVMSFKEKASAESIKLDVHPGSLILRGVKKLYKPERLRTMIRPEERLFPSEAPSYALAELQLEKWETELLPRVDGQRTVGELLALAQRPEPVVQGFLVALLALGVLERRA
ncbi:response regulator [Melittangium boletus]|uniref:response regulator n=1 Tax=Melittangium boletus TaxID=83453 RepID=UPI003DA30F39